MGGFHVLGETPRFGLPISDDGDVSALSPLRARE
jgi:hypothetical protein